MSADYSETKNEIKANTICHNVAHGGMNLTYYPNTDNDDLEPLFQCYSNCGSMDIYKFVRTSFSSKGMDMSFPDAVSWVADTTNKSFGFGFGHAEVEEVKEIDSDWDWLSRFEKKEKQPTTELITYSDRILDVFDRGYYPPNFLNDNITPEVMRKYDIMFYPYAERIVIPHRHPENGKIISLRSRATRQSDIDAGVKYLPLTIQGHLYSSPSYESLYGYWENKDTIRRLKKVIVFESEKSVMQCEAYFPNNNFSVALSGRNISQRQVDMLMDLEIEEIILATDKMFEKIDTDECKQDINFILRMARRFTPYVRVFALFDDENKIEYKSSPSDCGREILLDMMKKKKEVLNIE